MSSNVVTADQLVGTELADILRGLTPKLAASLADLDGRTVDDLTADLQIMPFGDRAALYAFDCAKRNARGQYKALPKLAELTRAARLIKDHLPVAGTDMVRFLNGA